MNSRCLFLALALAAASCGGSSSAGTDGATMDATDAAAADATDGAGDAGPACTNACPLATHRCGPNGGSQACAVASDGCTAWGTELPCQGVQTCFGASGTCVCPMVAGCTVAGKSCLDVHNLITCTADAQGCFSSTTLMCDPSGACVGGAPDSVCAPH